MKFTLSFEGALKTGGPKAEPKHARRREFHTQLKRLWQVHPLLSRWHLPLDQHRVAPAQDVLRKNHARFGAFEFVPLITKDLCVEVALNFHILRASNFKGNQADPDNIIKILVDSLKIPQDAGELPNGAKPSDDELPFFVLMQDDGLICKISSVTDELLQPIQKKTFIERTDTRAFLEIYIRPSLPTESNLIFFSDDFEVWNHRWSDGIFDSIRGWSNAELRARITQCVLRMRVTESNFRMQKSIIYNGMTDRSLREQSADLSARSAEQRAIWNSGLRPAAYALMEEVQRRLYHQPPYPANYGLMAIEHGSLAGVDPIGEAAISLESLARQLP